MEFYIVMAIITSLSVAKEMDDIYDIFLVVIISICWPIFWFMCICKFIESKVKNGSD